MPITTTETSFDGLKITSVPYSVLEAARSASLLTVGDSYLITDKADAGIIVDVSASNRISLRAKGLFLVPDFQDVGTYTTTPLPKGINQKVWSLSEQSGTPYANGDIVFLDGIMYQVIDDTLFDTNSPDSNASAYEALIKNVNNGYILETDAIIYNFTDDAIIERQDKRGNILNGNVNNFQWGNDNVFNNNINNNFTCINQKGTIRYNNSNSSQSIVFNNSFIADVSKNYFGNKSNVIFNDCGDITKCSFNSSELITLESLVSYSEKEIDNNHSTFDADLDMTDVAIFSAGVLTIPTILSFIGEFTLIGNDGQTITKIVNLSSVHKVTRFKTEAGNDQLFSHTGIGAAGANDLVADAISINTIVGRNFGGDFIEYEKDSAVNIRTNIVKLA